MIIKKIGTKSLAKLLGVLYGVLGLIAGVFFAIASLVSGDYIGIGAIVLFPILYGLMGLIGGFITAWLYNIVAAKIGGLEMDVE